ncbi:hypothetical protein BXY82_1412 [Gelidibacter sediminis]|uniref:REP element-mobilizing transposase RayT n=1 Tax=Gelidibacter sediminis TaxID=1608710 RepID=A0A4R7PWU8_9FLAO|nr:transposase [Gelidibacter sediminis]TDU39388.1 hypothetical protein BXY82_1412 [Gelidibacter sediminis]
MSEKFRNKYRIESTRLKHWDYGSNGAYFITICTKNRIQYFGDVVKTQNIASPQMKLSDIGKIADQLWLSIPEHFPFVKLGNHVIMPNHVHGIIIIDKTMGRETGAGLGAVATQNFASLQQQNKFGPKSKNLTSIIRGYKSSVKTYATTNSIDFISQPLFHDHIIRDTNSYQRISD